MRVCPEEGKIWYGREKGRYRRLIPEDATGDVPNQRAQRPTADPYAAE